MICELCTKNFSRKGGWFNKHLLEEHNIDSYIDYIVLIKHNGIHPVCYCGCGEKTNFFNNKFKKFIVGHNSFLSSKDLEKSRPIEDILRFYKEGKTGEEISKILNIEISYIFKILNKNKLTRNSSESKIKYKIDDTIFEKIDTEDKAYWFGFLYADGYINYKKNTTTLCLSKVDLDTLKSFNLFLKSEKPIRKNNKNSFKVVIENKKITNDLLERGLLQAKTHILKFPDCIKKEHISHFIRGYFDGDGSISYGKKINKNCIVSITSTLDFLNKINEIIDVNFSFTKRHKNRKDEIFTINTGGIINIMKFYNYIYSDCNIYMNRKKNKFEKWFDFYFKKTRISKKTKIIKNKFKL